MALQVGDLAPQFSLFNSDKNKVSLSDFKGRKVVLLFFPQAFTSVCTTELCSMRDNISFYSILHAEVLGISVDSVFTLGRFKADQGLNFPLLSDFNKEASAAYGCLYDTFVFDMKGVSKRSAFIIDREGMVAYAEVLDNAGNLPNFDAIKQVVESLA
jgi:peroxiredoxin